MPPLIVTQLSPVIGSVVEGLDLARDMSDTTIRMLIALLHQRGVVVMKDQSLSNAQYAEFGHQWGKPLEFFLKDHRDIEFPVIIKVDNDPAAPIAMRDGAVHWHSDSSYEAEPAAVTMLYGREAPSVGGVTHFASTAAAYDALPESTKTEIEDLIAGHELGGAPWIEGETEPDPNRPPHDLQRQRHPLVMKHPVTGRKAIFTSGTASGIEGMETRRARALIRRLRKHIVRPDFRIDYKILPGDIVLWDNCSTVHCATPIEYSNKRGKRRLLYRISTKGLPRLCTSGRP
jgi:taurine dioxygenase